MIVTWDDSGGWYDHVAPPPGPTARPGDFAFRFSCSPPGRARTTIPEQPNAMPYVSHTRRESTAITKFIEKNWKLGNMGQRDVTDDDLSDMFDYTRAAPVPPFSEVSMERLIRRTHFSLARRRARRSHRRRRSLAWS